MDEIPLPMFGVWLPGKGWLRGSNHKAFADYNVEVAKQTARRLGNHAQVYFIDEALVDIEDELLMAEKKKFNLRNAINYMKQLADNKAIARQILRKKRR